MALELIRATPDHAPALARIFFDAFGKIADDHGFPMDVPDPAVTLQIMQTLTSRPDCYGVTAIDDGKIVGCNFTQLSDAVSGVGPICIDPNHQSRGIGRKLMQHIVDYSLRHHGPMVRLLQDSFNMTSLSLYSSIGFTVQEPMLLMQATPPTPPASPSSSHAHPAIRPLAATDLPAADALCQSVYHVSRKNELAIMIEHGPAGGATPLGYFRDGRLSAALIPGFMGFSVADSDADLLDTAQESARISPPHNHRLFIPTRRGPLLQKALQRQFKAIKIMNLMSIGPYQSPTGPWTSSVAY